jgi:hypothetical protein
MAGKWLELLNEIVPGVTRAVAMFDRTNTLNAEYARAYADLRIPNIFTLTYLPTFQDGRWLDATNEWEKQNTRPEFSTGTRPESSTITRPETDTTGGAYAGFPRPESDTPIYNLGRKGGGLRDGCITYPVDQPPANPQEGI